MFRLKNLEYELFIYMYINNHRIYEYFFDKVVAKVCTGKH